MTPEGHLNDVRPASYLAGNSQRMIVPSDMPATRVLPSGVKATRLGRTSVFRVAFSLPVTRSQRTIFSAKGTAAARVLPSGEKATLETLSPWSSVAFASPRAGSQRRSDL